MSRPRVYVETTIPSFYYETRAQPEIMARREWTRQWWSSANDQFQLVTSPAVLDELASGPPERCADWLALVADLPLLIIEPAIAEIAQVYIRHKVMPADPVGEGASKDCWLWQRRSRVGSEARSEAECRPSDERMA